MAGLVRPASGQIRLDGRPVGGMTTHRLVRLGVSLAPEGRQVFPRFTVEENLAGGAYSRRDAAAVAGDRAHLFALFPILEERQRQPAGTLSGGEQQMLTIASGPAPGSCSLTSRRSASPPSWRATFSPRSARSAAWT